MIYSLFLLKTDFKSERHYPVTPLDSMKGQKIVHEDTWKSKNMVALLDWSTDFKVHRNIGLHSSIFILADTLQKTKRWVLNFIYIKFTIFVLTESYFNRYQETCWIYLVFSPSSFLQGIQRFMNYI